VVMTAAAQDRLGVSGPQPSCFDQNRKNRHETSAIMVNQHSAFRSASLASVFLVEVTAPGIYVGSASQTSAAFDGSDGSQVHP
jgi:hypothetical protein